MTTIIQGESFPILIRLKKSGGASLTPDDIADLMICLDTVSKQYSKGQVTFQEQKGGFEFCPSQEDTAAMNPGFHAVWCSIKYCDGIVKKVEGETVKVQRGHCGVIL